MKKRILPLFLVNLLLFICIHSPAQNNKQKRIDSLMEKCLKQTKFTGNILVAEKGQVLFKGCYGLANRANSDTLDENSLFELASVSKQFTAMAIMLLREKGKLSLQDSLRKFFPDLPYSNITIHHLLTHTSGLPDYMGLLTEKWDHNRIATNKDMIQLMAKEKPAAQFKPGEKWEYSNTGYMLLASIVEKASGTSFASFLQKNIFDPLQMNRSQVYMRRYSGKKINNYAYGYVYRDRQKVFMLPDDIKEMDIVIYADGIYGDGTVNSTIIDLYKWDRALYTSRLIKPSVWEEIATPVKLDNGTVHNYGYGWATSTNTKYGKMVSHTGGWPGYNTLITRYTEQDKTIIILCNSGFTPTMLSQGLQKILFDE